MPLRVNVVGAMPVLTKNPDYATAKRLNCQRSPFSRLPQALETKTQETQSVIYQFLLKLLFSILTRESGIIASAFMIVLY